MVARPDRLVRARPAFLKDRPDQVQDLLTGRAPVAPDAGYQAAGVKDQAVGRYGIGRPAPRDQDRGPPFGQLVRVFHKEDRGAEVASASTSKPVLRIADGHRIASEEGHVDGLYRLKVGRGPCPFGPR